MTINPRIGLYLSILGVIIGVFANLPADKLAAMFGQSGGPLVAAWSPALMAILLGVNGVLHMIPAPNTPQADAKFLLGPATPAVPPAAKAVLFFAVLLLSAFALALPSHAQTPQRRPHITGNPIEDIKADMNDQAGTAATLGGSALTSALAKPFQDLAAFLSSDAAAAIALSTQIPALQDGHGQQCWIAMSTAGDVFKAHPVPLTLKVMTDVEALRLLAMTANNLCSNVHCTQVFADLTSMAQAASPVALPIPGLHDLCSKIPQIAQAAPVTPPAAPAVAAPTPAPAAPAPPQ